MGEDNAGREEAGVLTACTLTRTVPELDAARRLVGAWTGLGAGVEVTTEEATDESLPCWAQMRLPLAMPC